jgi:hypothetical protein
MSFQGRTPCHEFAEVHPGPNCQKLKWFVIFYADTKTHRPTTYRMNGTAYRKDGPKTGTWKIISGKDGRLIYQLSSNTENAFIYLLKLDDNVLIFTDEQGKLLVGNEDFSFTLSRKR